MLSSTHKERVEIISGNTRKMTKKYKILDGNTIELKKASKGRGKMGKYAKFDPAKSYYYYTGKIFRGLKRKLYLVDGASKCVEFGKEINLNAPTTQEIINLFDAKVFDKSGVVGHKIEVPLLLYLLIGGVLVLQIFMFMNAQGLVR